MDNNVSESINEIAQSLLPLMPDLPEPKRFGSLSEIYLDLILNRTFLIALGVGALGFFLLQKFGETVYDKVVRGTRRRRISKQLLGTYFQSIFHAIGMSICSYLVIFKFVDNPEMLLNVSKDDEAYFYVVLYKACTVLSMSYFIILTPYELFGIEQTMNFRVTMAIHHVAGVLAQALIVMSNPVFIVVGAMTLQCEFSTIFLNMRIFGMTMENKYIYFIGGVGALITYPLTRIVFYVYNIQRTYALMDTFSVYLGINAFYLTMFSQVFVLCMSVGYTIVLWKSPRKMIMLKTDRNKKRE